LVCSQTLSKIKRDEIGAETLSLFGCRVERRGKDNIYKKKEKKKEKDKYTLPLLNSILNIYYDKIEITLKNH
jgi:hypothetical protein